MNVSRSVLSKAWIAKDAKKARKRRKEKLARGKLFPTLPTLLRIAMASEQVWTIFTEARKREVVVMVIAEGSIRR